MNKKGFTLIELLAVIIILGILMIIAIPSVTSYINNSRKSAYVNTAKEIIAGARNVVNDGKLEMFSKDTTYYISSGYIKTENASKSPYGDFVYAYVGVIYDGTGYKYYWISVDETKQGVKDIVAYDQLDEDDIVSGINPDEINTAVHTTGIGNRHYIKILKSDGTWETQNPIYLDDISNNVSEEGGSPSESSSGGSGGSNNPTNYLFDGKNSPTTSSPTSPPTGKNLYLGLYEDNSLAVCIKRSGVEHCFKINNFDVEKEHVQEAFSDISCTVYSFQVSCNDSVFQCTVGDNGDVGCFNHSADSYCGVSSNGGVYCR